VWGGLGILRCRINSIKKELFTLCSHNHKNILTNGGYNIVIRPPPIIDIKPDSKIAAPACCDLWAFLYTYKKLKYLLLSVGTLPSLIEYTESISIG
jgi:hypothetical protein